MAIKINSLQGVSTMSANGTNRYSRVDPRINRNPLWNFTVLQHTFQGTVAGYAMSSSVNDKFPFASDVVTNIGGSMSVNRGSASGQSSNVSGYNSGGYGRFPLSPATPITVKNTIDKFPFATDANATDVGDLTVTRQRPAGQSSTVRGYTSGGFPTTNVIDRFPFAADANATDVGDLTATMMDIAGQQD